MFLNVFVPIECDAINSKAKLAVVIYIFGGRLVFGSGRHYAPDFFIETNVIIVSKKFVRTIDLFAYDLYKLSIACINTI